jgi:hypothetical protein
MAQLFWVLVIIVMTSIGMEFMIQKTKEYMNSKLINNIESSTAPLEVLHHLTQQGWMSSPGLNSDSVKIENGCTRRVLFGSTTALLLAFLSLLSESRNPLVLPLVFCSK